MRNLIFALTLAVMSVCVAAPSAAEKPDQDALRRNWPGFRGYLGVGVCQDRKPPTEWDGKSGRNILWKTEIPLPGFNSPVVWEDRVFLTGATDTERVVYCLDAQTGAKRWQTEVRDLPASPAKPPEVTRQAGYASSTMACDGQRVFAIFANGDLACLDFDGRRLWAKSFGLPEIDYGFVSSLLAYDGRLYVQWDEIEGGQVLALSTETGSELWRAKRKVTACWCSPLLAETSRGPQLVLNGHPTVAAYQPATGAELWKVDCMRGELTPSPAFSDGTVVVAQDYSTCAAIRVGASKLVWEQWDIDLPDTSSPVAHAGLVFLPTSVGTVYCLRLKDGTVAWMHEYDEGFHASPIVVDDIIFLPDFKGRMRIFKAADTFQEIGAPELGEDTICTPAFVGDRIFVRSERHVYAIAKQ